MMDNGVNLSPELIRGAVESVADAFERMYFDVDAATEMGARLRTRLAGGAYAGAESLGYLAAALSKDLREVRNDHHVSVVVSARNEDGDDAAYSEQVYERYARDNYGFRRVEVFPGSVGYLDLRLFCPAQVAGATAVAAVNFLAGTRALIFDLRRNGGGEDGMVRLLAGYLFDEATELCSIRHRGLRGLEQSRSLDYVPGPRLARLPAYVLTSQTTFSAAEDFTYNLQQRGRAVVVGEQTRGGAHTLEFVPLPEYGLELGIPEGEAINPISKGNWEGTGVTPDIVVPADQALDVAYRHALERLRAALTDPGDLFGVDWALDGIRARLQPAIVDAGTLSLYAGNYGLSNHIRVENGTLHVQHEGYPELAATPLARDLFEYDGGAARVRFEVEGGKAREAVFLTEDGQTFVCRRSRAGGSDLHS